MSCSTKISNELAFNCANAPVAGTEVDIYLANRDDIDSYTLNGTNPLIIEGITMKAGKFLYKYTGSKNAWDPSASMNKGKYLNNFVHVMDGVLGVNSPTDKQELENLCKSNVVAFVENKKKGSTGNEAFEAYGVDVGLEMETFERKLSDSETQGSYKFQMKSPADQFESHLPKTVFITSLAATRAMLEALRP